MILCPTARPTTSSGWLPIAASIAFARCSHPRPARIARVSAAAARRRRAGRARRRHGARRAAVLHRTDVRNQLRRSPRSDAQLQRARDAAISPPSVTRSLASNPRARRAAGLRQDEGARRSRLRSGRAAAARAAGHRARCARWASPGATRRCLRARRATAPQLLAACSSAAAMWVANAATVSPSADTADGRVHFTPANLVSHFHRSLEAPTTTRVLRAIFADDRRFAVHDALPAHARVRRRRRGQSHALRSRRRRPPASSSSSTDAPASTQRCRTPTRFPARQTREASEAVARRHALAPERTLYAQQHPEAIDTGVFHNDVVAVGSGAVLFCHERAYRRPGRGTGARWRNRSAGDFTPIVVRESEVSLERAVATYLFNSQLIERPDGGMLLVAPSECRRGHRCGHAPRAARHQRRPDSRGAHLRSEAEHAERRRPGLPAAARRADACRARRDHARRSGSTKRCMPRSSPGWSGTIAIGLLPADLADPALLDESRRALDELSQLLGLGTVYPFQSV